MPNRFGKMSENRRGDFFWLTLNIVCLLDHVEMSKLEKKQTTEAVRRPGIDIVAAAQLQTGCPRP